MRIGWRLLCGALLPLAATLSATSAKAELPAGRYRIDSSHTHTSFTVIQFGLVRLTGRFDMPTGMLTIGGKLDKAVVDVTFPMDRLTTGKAAADRLLRGSSIFDVAHYPTAHFVAQVPVSGTAGPIDGDLTIHGVTRHVTLQAQFTGARVDPGTQLTQLGFKAGHLPLNRCLQ